MAIELNSTPTPNLHAFPLTQTIWERGLAMISYFQAVRELDARWTGSLQFLPPPPTLRNEHDCIVARQIASTEIDLFHRYAREIAAANGLKLGLLVDLYDIMLSTGLMLDDELYEVRSVWRQSPAPKRAPSSSASKPNRMNRRLHRTQHHRE